MVLGTIKNYLIKEKWALAAILIGTVVGFISAVICVYANLVIFGFNIMFIISPLIAGFTESYIARKKHGKSTGAISALLIFIIINIYGWLFPKDPIVMNLYTLGGLALMIQAAVPILVNYILFVVFLGTLTYVIGYVGNLLSRILFRGTKSPVAEVDVERIDFHQWGVLPVTSSIIQGKHIDRYLGYVEGEHIFSGSGEKSYIKTREQQQVEFLNKLEKAKHLAITSLLEQAKNMGANGLIEVQVEYVEIGGIKGSEILVRALGTAVVYSS